MKIDLKKQVLDKEGNPATARAYEMVETEVDGDVVREQQPFEKGVTLGSLISHSMIRSDSEEDEKVIEERYDIFLKTYDKDEVELSDEEVAYCKEMVCKAYDVFFAGQVLKLLK